MTKDYLKAPKELTSEVIFKQLIIDFYSLQSKSGNLAKRTDSSKIIDQSEQCLATLVFILLCDTNNFANNTFCTREYFNSMTDTIYQTILEFSPGAIKFSLEIYKSKAQDYLWRRFS